MGTKAKTHDFKGEVYAKIPDSVVKKLGIEPGDEIEFLEEGGKIIVASGEKALREEELTVLKKVNSVKHYERTRENIAKLLSGAEPSIFSRLFEKKVLFDYEKEGKRLVGISKEFFLLVVEKEDPLITKLFAQGYLVLSEPSEANALNDRLQEAKRDSEVRGVRGFDTKYYVMTLQKLSEIEAKIMRALESEKVLADLSSELKAPEDLCKAAIEVMKEDGSVIEKKKDVFVSV